MLRLPGLLPAEGETLAWIEYLVGRIYHWLYPHQPWQIAQDSRQTLRILIM